MSCQGFMICSSCYSFSPQVSTFEIVQSQHKKGIAAKEIINRVITADYEQFLSETERWKLVLKYLTHNHVKHNLSKWNPAWKMSGGQHIIQIYLCEITDMVVLKHLQYFCFRSLKALHGEHCLLCHCVSNGNNNVTLSPLSCFACQYYPNWNFPFDYVVGLAVPNEYCAHFIRNGAQERQVAFRCLHT